MLILSKYLYTKEHKLFNFVDLFILILKKELFDDFVLFISNLIKVSLLIKKSLICFVIANLD